jgi:hypothetical protein
MGHRHIVGERTDRASIGTSHASDDEDGNRKSERNRDHIPPSKVLGEEIARFLEFAGEGAACAADVQGRGRRRAFNDLDTGFSARYHLDSRPNSSFIALLTDLGGRPCPASK